jgi:hypothetical protein
VETNNVIFTANKIWLSKESKSAPSPIIKTIPEWYRKADRFAKSPNNEYIIGPDKGKIPTFKACPSIFDIMGTGYSFNTPCDIEFYKKDGKTLFKIANKKYDFFLQHRDELPEFEHPRGYSKSHFAWTPDWQIRLPEGYSALYSPPFNRFELPFLTTSGIIDNDKLHNPGSLPFFLFDDFEGVIPAGTPYVQILPFKRENWTSEILEQSDSIQIIKDSMDVISKYRKPDGGIYKNEVWERRKYE